MEIFLALVQNFVSVAQVLTVVLAIISSVTGINFWLEKMSGGSTDGSFVSFKLSLIATLVLLPITCIPTIDDLWRIRIGLIKYQLASPENVESSVQAIERIAEKLECKYLECDKKDDNTHP